MLTFISQSAAHIHLVERPAHIPVGAPITFARTGEMRISPWHATTVKTRRASQSPPLARRRYKFIQRRVCASPEHTALQQVEVHMRMRLVDAQFAQAACRSPQLLANLD